MEVTKPKGGRRIMHRIGPEELRLVSELTRERNNLNQLAFLQHAFGVASHEEELRRIGAHQPTSADRQLRVLAPGPSRCRTGHRTQLAVVPPRDTPRMSDQLMLDLTQEYMQRMEITDTQYLVVRHTATKHPHLHILYNRVRYDTTLAPDRKEPLRNMRICKELKPEYGLTFSHGKEQVATERLYGPEQLRHRIHDCLRELLPNRASWTALVEELVKQHVATIFVHRRRRSNEGDSGRNLHLGGGIRSRLRRWTVSSAMAT